MENLTRLPTIKQYGLASEFKKSLEKSSKLFTTHTHNALDSRQGQTNSKENLNMTRYQSHSSYLRIFLPQNP